MNRIRMAISALALAVVAVTATGGPIAAGSGASAVVADRWCC